jgi:translation initiation factor 1
MGALRQTHECTTRDRLRPWYKRPSVGQKTRRTSSTPVASTRLVYSTAGDKAPANARVAEAPRAAGGKGVRLRLETRPSGRSVTLVLGLPGGEAEWTALLAALRTTCHTGGSLKDGIVELQGDQREKARAALAARGIKAR